MVQSERDKTLPIENDTATSGEDVILEKYESHDKLNVRIDGDASASYELQVSDREGSWFTETSYSSTTDVDDTGRDITERFVRLTVTTGTGTASDTADVLLSAAGGDT